MLRILAGLTALTLAASTASSGSRADRLEREVAIGGLFSLSGSWSTLGQTSRVAMELAVESINEYLAGNAAGIRFVAAIEDTQLDPRTALAKAQALRARGVQLFIGPQSSAELEHLKAFADANGLLLISPSSTAGTLAVRGDNVFRFTPPEGLEAVAISSMIWEDGIRAIVPLWRDDAGNEGLVRATRARFGALGGSVLEGVKYSGATTDFSNAISALTPQIADAVARHGKERVAVYATGFDEIASLFVGADSAPVLTSVRWYGSDGVAHSDTLVTNRTAAVFAERAGFPIPIFGLDPGARDIWEPLANSIRTRTALEPDAFALAVYDAVWVVARAYIASGATPDIEQLKRAFTTAARSGFGATGWTILDEAGDRKYGDFEFWAIRREGDAFRWTRVARYESRTGRLVR
jgi:branched-chain amino acid transport system substrate-binding protein